MAIIKERTLNDYKEAMIKSSKELYENLYQRILPAAHSSGECRSITLRVLHHYYQCDALAVALDQQLLFSVPTNFLQEIVLRLHAQEPIQYILQTAYFLDLPLMVTPAVLIPRPETEELVSLIVRENTSSDLQVLDIGTGSGCIAIALKKGLSNAHVDALDISEQALKVAIHNAAHHQVHIHHWYQRDILQNDLPDRQWNIIVSNPPYVCMSEKQHMQQRVMSYEPHQALFISDETPLIFYERIAQLASTHLKPMGKLYLEINERSGADVTALFNVPPWKEICIGKDLHGKDRWITVHTTH